MTHKGFKHSEETKKKISEAMKGRKLSEEHKRKILEVRKGLKHSEKSKKKMSESHKGQISWNKGLHYDIKTWDNLLYVQKHVRMKRIIPKPNICPICDKEKKLELTNLDHEYSDNIYSWIWKCKKCHKNYDKKELIKN